MASPSRALACYELLNPGSGRTDLRDHGEGRVRALRPWPRSCTPASPRARTYLFCCFCGREGMGGAARRSHGEPGGMSFLLDEGPGWAPPGDGLHAWLASRLPARGRYLWLARETLLGSTTGKENLGRPWRPTVATEAFACRNCSTSSP